MAAAPRYVAALPRERYSATLRERLRGMVASAYGTDHVEQHEVFGENDRVYLHLPVEGGGRAARSPTSPSWSGA